MQVDVLIFTYVLTLLAGLGAVLVFDEFRRKQFEPAPSEDKVFRCGKCRFVYTDDPDVDRSVCPQCHSVNDPFRF